MLININHNYKKKLIGINLLDYNPLYKGGINSFIDGFLEGIIEIKQNKNFVIFAKKGNEKYFKNYENFFKIYYLKYNKRFAYFSYLIAAIFNSKTLIYFFNKFFTKKNFNFIYKITKLIYTPTSILTCYSFKGKDILSPHDIQHLYHPENFNFFRYMFRKITFEVSIIKASKIQVSSNLIKKNILESYKIAKNKIFYQKEGVNIKRFYSSNHKKQKIIFFPAYWWPHKNHDFIIDSIQDLIKKKKLSYKLIMCGGIDKKNIEKIQKLSHLTNNQITHLGLIPKKKLKNLFNSSQIVLSPATYESSSLPLLEAAATKNVIVASNTESNLHHKDNLKINYYKLNNQKSFQKTLLNIIQNKALLKKQINHNTKNIGLYSWKKVCKNYINLFNSYR